jgi:hypothetical protein
MRVRLRATLQQVWREEPNAVRVSLRLFDELSSANQTSLLKSVPVAVVLSKVEAL